MQDASTRIIDVQPLSPTTAGEPTGVTRRSFVQLAAGAIALLPTVTGGFALMAAPERAHAADSTSPSVEIVIAKPNEAGIAVADMSSGKRTPVPGATVIITSNENKKTITGKTGENGVFIADLSQLTKPKKNSVGVDVYAAEASLVVRKEGYRTFETGWKSFKGAAGFDVPTSKLGDEPAYPKRATLSDWDILYTNNDFAVTPANNDTHTIAITFCARERKQMNVSLVNVKAKKAIARGTVRPKAKDESGWFVGTVEFSGAYLFKNHADALPVGGSFRIDFTVDGKGYSMPLHLMISAAPSAVSAPFSKKMSFGPFDDDDMKLMLRMPEWVPLLSGKPVSLWRPSLPIDVRFDPYGYFRASLRTPEWGYRSKNGKVVGQAWKKLPRKTMNEQFNETWNEMASYGMKTAAYMVNGSRSTFSAFPTNKSLSLAFSAEAAVAGKWYPKGNAFRGKGQLRGVLTFAFSLSRQLFAGPVPFILQFDLNLVAAIGAGCGVIIPYDGKFGKWEYDFPSTGVSFTLYISPALSVGVGIKGIASVSLQGMLTFTLFVGAGPLPEGGKETNPHVLLGLTAQVRVVVQLLFFTMPFDIWKYDIPKLYDNWDPKKLYSQSVLDTQAAPPSFSEWFSENPPTEMSLGNKLVEFAGDGVQLSQQAISAGARFERSVEEHETEDGMAYRIMTFEPAGARSANAADEAGSLAAASAPGLAAQDDTLQGHESSLRTQVTISAYSARENGHGYKTDAFGDLLKALKLADNAGMSPAKKHCIAKNVLSDPRVKVVSIYGKAVMFRIAAVKVANKMRTRIVAQRLQTATEPAGDLQVIDFEPNVWNSKANDGKGARIERNDLWDYDFDVIVLTNLHSSYQAIELFVISGLREDGAKIGQVATDQVFQHVRFDVTTANWSFDLQSVRAQGVWAGDFHFDKEVAQKYPYHNFSCPHIEYAADYPGTDEAANKDRAPNDELFLTFLDRAATNPDLVLLDDDKNVRISVGFCSTSTIAGSGDMYKMLMFDLSAMTAKCQDSSVYELICSKRIRKDQHSGYNIITLRGSKKAYHFRLLTTTFVLENDKNLRTRILKAALWHTSTHDGFLDDEDSRDVMKFIDWPGHDSTFLASVDGKLQSVKMTVGKDGGILPVYTEVGPADFSIISFGVDPTGTMLYYPTVSEGSPGYQYESKDSVSNITSKPQPKVEHHRIMACRLRNGKFSDPFVFAEVPYDMDDLNLVNMSSDSIGFVSTDIVDAQKGQADLYYTVLPFVKCANVIGCKAVSAFAYPGTDALFDLTVRNDGNTYITGFTAQLVQKGSDKVEGTKQITFSADTLQESNFNPKENGKLKDVEDDFALAPGKTSVYRVALSIPKGWQGTKKVCVKTADVVVAAVKAANSSLAAQATGLATQAAASSYVDGDHKDSNAYHDVDAYEYAVGSNAKDFDDEFGEPYDVLDIRGEARFFDEDDYDDYDENIKAFPGDRGDYDLQMHQTPITTPKTGQHHASGNAGMSSGTPGSNRESAATAKADSTTRTTAQSAPRTADANGPLSGLLAGAALAGAAMAAYSARRVANEAAERAASQGAGEHGNEGEPPLP